MLEFQASFGQLHRLQIGLYREGQGGAISKKIINQMPGMKLQL